MSPSTRISCEAHRIGVRIGDRSLVDTLEIAYLRSVLDAMPPEWRTAVDLGAGTGDASAELLARGLRVLGVESDASLAAALRLRFDAELRARRFQLGVRGAAERDGALSQMLDAHGFREIGLARVAAHGRQWPALNALISRRGDLPAIVTFRVDAGASDVALGCIAFLWSHGYGTFDVFIKRGADPVAADRFAGPELPASWPGAARGTSAGFIAYHASRGEAVRRLNPQRFLSDFQILKSQHLLRCALKQEARATFEDGVARFGMDGLIASRIRSELRFDILTGGWGGFLVGRIGRHLGAGAHWGSRHERRRSALTASRFGRSLINRLVEPRIGLAGVRAPGTAGMSVPMISALYNMMQLHDQTDGRLPQRVVEVAGGWGLGSYIYSSVIPRAAYMIVDHPEALAIQHYFLTLSLPGTEVALVEAPQARLKEGSILLAPTGWLRRSDSFACELLHSSRAIDQLVPSLRTAVRQFRGPGASNTCFAGKWAFEGTELRHTTRAIAA